MTDKRLTEESGKLQHTETSPTAASRWDPKFGPSGAMDYRVILAAAGGAGQKAVRINAVSGDEAAAKALEAHPGWKVAYVGPFTDTTLPRMADAESE